MKAKRTIKKLLLKQETEVQLDHVDMKAVRGGDDLPQDPLVPVVQQEPQETQEPVAVCNRRRAVTVW